VKDKPTVHERVAQSFVWRTFFIQDRKALNRAHIVLHSLTALGLVILMQVLGGTPWPQAIVGMFLFAFVWTRSGRRLLLDFGLFFILLIAYEATRNYADEVSPSAVHITDLIDWEKSLFGGTVPAYYLQRHLWGQPYTFLLDALTNFLYVLHFLSPLLLAVVLWLYRYDAFWAFMVSLVVLSYAAFVTYVLFPAAPPWWATYYGYLSDQPVSLAHFTVSAERLLSYGGQANLVAAIPSLHAAYPTLITLVAWHVWGKRIWPLFVLPVAVIFATLYLGHHYMVDALLGVVYAGGAFGGVYMPIVRWWNTGRQDRQRLVPVHRG